MMGTSEEATYGLYPRKNGETMFDMKDYGHPQSKKFTNLNLSPWKNQNPSHDVTSKREIVIHSRKNSFTWACVI